MKVSYDYHIHIMNLDFCLVQTLGFGEFKSSRHGASRFCVLPTHEVILTAWILCNVEHVFLTNKGILLHKHNVTSKIRK